MTMNELWQNVFGTGWEVLTRSFSHIGGFIIDLENKKVMMDENAKAIMCVNDDTDFETVTTIIRRLEKHLDVSTPIRIRFVIDNDDERAGYVYVDEESGLTADSMLPVINQAKLLRLMGGSLDEPLLALIQIEGISTPSLENAYIYSAINTIRNFIPNRGLIAANSAKRYWIFIPDFVEEDEYEFIQNLKTAVENCQLKDEFGYLISKHHSMTITAGIGLKESFPAERMHTARFALYEASGMGIGSIREFSIENYETQKNDYHNIRLFSQLIEKNLFQYAFQPIINAHTAEIIAYEALMRTDKSIGYGPLQVLDIAKKYDRLYDVEKATFFNIYDFVSKNTQELNGAKVYINAIPGHMLTDDDYEKLTKKYGDYMKSSVIELTEQTELSDETLQIIHDRFGKSGIQLAIDDYGTGYSNTTNLLRYNPSVVKIDRSLISNIEGNQKTMNIVGNIIDFLHNNGYLALAEGVETADELEVMIDLGADLIQGYYIGRPKFELIHEIAPEIKKEILKINHEHASAVSRVYKPVENEEVDLLELATQNYTTILIDVPHVSIIGSNTSKVPMLINVKDDTETEIKIHDVFLTSVSSMEVLHLGMNTKVRLMCSGKNCFDRKGVLVSKTSALQISGYGELIINSEAKNSYAIGNDSKHSHGDITIDMNGRIVLNVNGDTCVGIGAGRNRENKKIKLLRGLYEINCSGGECVGIGTFDGNSNIEVNTCSCRVKLASPTAVGIGSLRGSTNINANHYDIDCNSTGTAQIGLGVLTEGSGKVYMSEGKLSVTLRGEDISCVGSKGGNVDITIDRTTAVLYCEGNNVSGIGDMFGGGEVNLEKDDLYIKFITGNGYPIGSPNGITEVTGCKKNFHINE